MMAISRPRVAALVCGVAGLVLVNTLPVVLGVLKTHLGLGATALGAYASAETIGSALGSFGAIFVIRRQSPRIVAGVGLVLAFAADVASFWIPTIAALTAVRWVGGFGVGFTQSACYLVYGESHREQNQAIYSIGQTGLAFLTIWIVPLVESTFGWRALYLDLALLMVPALFLVRYFPSSTIQPPIAGHPRENGPLSPAVWLAIAGVTMFFVGQGSLWAFLETIGDASGFSATTVHTAMTICAAFGTLGPIVVLVVAERIRPVFPLIGTTALTIIAVCFMQSRSVWIYGAAISMFYFCLSIFAAYQFGVIARLERSGRAAVMMSSANYAGFSVSAYVGGQMVEHFGYSSLAWFDGIMMSSALMTLLWLMASSGEARHSETNPCTPSVATCPHRMAISDAAPE